MIKTRFAPSPTGFLHIGGLRTALFAYLFAKKNNGVFAVRIEDTDRERFVEGGIENILNSLTWAGVIPDEGVKLDANDKIVQVGELGPYIQSERLSIYKKYVEMLLTNGHAYHCFCSQERLEEARKKQEEQHLPTGYDGFCRNLDSEQIKNRLLSGESYVVRMKMPKSGETKFVDLIRGEVSFKNELIDDQVILKSDGFPTYHLAVVVDDHLMGITHVFRGEEWLSSTPKHLVLYEMFGWQPPQFAHLSLLVNEKKQKLSKRHGDVSVTDFKEAGYLGEALVNFVAFLGWNPGGEREIFSLEDLEKEFSVEKISKSPAVFNRDKLNWYNSHYIKNLDLNNLLKVATPFLVNGGLIKEEEIEAKKEWLKKVLIIVKERIHTLGELREASGFLFADDLVYEGDLLVWKKGTKEDAKDKLQKISDFLAKTDEDVWQDISKIELAIKNWISQNEFGIGDVLWPLRVALSGQKNSPTPFELVFVLGKERTLNRINVAINKIG